MGKEQGNTTNVVKKEDDRQTKAVMISQDTIQNMVYVIRGQQVMLDSDLALLYQTETRVLNQAVKRNIMRFPEKFCFQLTDDEFRNLKSQFVIASLMKEKEDNYGGRRTFPYAFSEQGIAMLSAVLRSDIAIQVSIRIMEIFVEMRKYMASSALLIERMSKTELKQREFEKKTDERFEQVFDYITNHEGKKQKIFFDGQIYDAFSLLVQLVAGAKKSLVLVDNYVDVETLNILAKKNKNTSVCIYTHKNTKLTALDVKNFNQQYPKLEVKYTEKFHDRFLIIDDIKAYHIGASLKDAGKKCFAVSLMEDKGLIKDILQRLRLNVN